MKRTVLLSIIFSLTICVAGVSAQKKKSPGKKAAPAKIDAKIDVVKTAPEELLLVLDAQGKKDGNRYYNPEAFTDAKMSLALTVSPLDLGIIDDDFKRKIYGAWAEGLLASDGGGKKTVKVSEKEFAATGSFGLEVVADHGEFRVQARMICMAGKCYYLVVGSATPDALKAGEYAQVEKWTKKFFDSFQVIK